jgi:predicted transposase YdaD
MRESSTYQAILEEGAARGREEGRAVEVKRILLLQGRIRFGEPDSAARASLEAIADLQTLERLATRLVQVESWDELLAS